MKEITLKAEKSNIPVATEFVEALLEGAACPMKPMMQINIALDEILSNIASYAYEGSDGEFCMRVDLEKKPGFAVITFEDSGVPYNPLEKDDPDLTLSAEERAIGGLGIFMVKKTMDEMEYEYSDGKNILTIVKKISL